MLEQNLRASNLLVFKFYLVSLKAMSSSKTLRIEVSVGDALDKMSILEIKAELFVEVAKVSNVLSELDLLRNEILSSGIHVNEELYKELKKINLIIFRLMDKLFETESAQSAFAEIAKETINLNMERSRVKRKINELSHSKILEEKTYF